MKYELLELKLQSRHFRLESRFKHDILQDIIFKIIRMQRTYLKTKN